MPTSAQWLLVAAVAVYRTTSTPLPNPNPSPNPSPAPFLPPFNLLTHLLGFGQSSGTLDGSLDSPQKPKKPCSCYGAPASSYGAPHSSYGAPSYKAPKKHKKKKKCKPSYHGRKRRSPDHGGSSDDFNFGSDGLFDDGGFGGFGGAGFSSEFDSEFHTHGHKKKPKKRKCH